MKKKIAYGVTGLILGCIFLFPIYILIMNSFKTTKGIFTDVLGFPAKGTFTLENYKNAFQELDYIRSFMNSLLITVVTAVLVLLISAMAAWVLVRYKTKASKIIFLIFAGSMLIPFQCVMLPLVGFASKIGLLSRGGLIFMYMGFQTSMARIDSVMYDLAPAHTGRRGRPAKHGKQLSVETDFTFSGEKIGDYYTGVRRVFTRIFGNQEVLAYVTATEKEHGKKRLFSVRFFQKNCRFSVHSRKKHH